MANMRSSHWQSQAWRSTGMLLAIWIGLSSMANGDEVAARVGQEVAPGEFRIEASEAGYRVFEGETPVLFYQQQMKSADGKWPRANYVHPLYDLDGRVITEDFPADHGHHRGIFWAWHQVIIGDKHIGDSWECKKFSWDVKSVERAVEVDSAGLDVEVFWLSPDWTDEDEKQKPFVKEQTSIRVHRATATERMIDFTICIQALEPNLKLGGSNDVKGYGGFSPRIRLNPSMKFSGEKGAVEPATTAVDAGRWFDITGDFRESIPENPLEANDEAKPSGVTILTHRSIPGFPRPWILRRSRSMQNPVFPGTEPVDVPMDNPLTLKYRLVLHRGEVAAQTINEWQDAFK